MLTFHKSRARIAPVLGTDGKRFYAVVQTAIGEHRVQGQTLEEAKSNLARELSKMGEDRFLPDQLYMPVPDYRAGWIEIEVCR